MATKQTTSSTSWEKKAKRTAKKQLKKFSFGQKAFLVAILLIALLLGAGAGYFVTRNDEFTLVSRASLTCEAGKTFRYEDSLCEVTAIYLGQDKSGELTVTTGLPVADDGTVTPEPGIYYTTYVMKTVFGQEIKRIQTITVIPPATAAFAEGGVYHG